MNKKISVLSVVITTALLLTVLISAKAVIAASGAPRVTTLSGAEEVPPRATNGSGFASIRLNVGQGTVCWELTVSNLTAQATAAHIHRAPVGVSGPIVVPLTPPTGGSSSGCQTSVNSALIQEIIDFPERFYVNVHTTTFPGGEIRGQLSNRGQSE